MATCLTGTVFRIPWIPSSGRSGCAIGWKRHSDCSHSVTKFNSGI